MNTVAAAMSALVNIVVVSRICARLPGGEICAIAFPTR